MFQKLRGKINTWKATKDTHPHKKGEKTPISLAFFIFSSVRSLTTAPTLSPKTPQFPQQGFPPQRVPTEASYLAPIKPPGMQLKPENQTDSKLCLFHPAKNPQSQQEVVSVNTPIVTTMMSNGNIPVSPVKATITSGVWRLGKILKC